MKSVTHPKAIAPSDRKVAKLEDDRKSVGLLTSNKSCNVGEDLFRETFPGYAWMPDFFKRSALKRNAEYSNQSDGSIHSHDQVYNLRNASVRALDDT